MAFRTPGGFTSAQDFTLFDEAMQRLESEAFLTGIRPGTQEVRGIAEGALRVGAEKELGRETLARQFELGQQELDIQRSRQESLAAFEHEQIRGQEKAQRASAISGFAQFGALALLMRGGGTTSVTAPTKGVAGGTTTTTTRNLPSVLQIIKNLGDPLKWFG